MWADLRHRHAPIVGLRTFYWAILRGYDGEACQFCGRPYPLWHAPDGLWMDLIGHYNALCCLNCFDGFARKRGFWLRWTPERAS